VEKEVYGKFIERKKLIITETYLFIREEEED